MPAGKCRFGFPPGAGDIETDGRAAEDGPREDRADRVEAFRAAAARSGAVARLGAGDMADYTFSPEGKNRIAAAIAAAESKTAGEIYVVIARGGEEFHYVPVIWAALAALLLPWPLHLLTSLSTTTILVLQAMVFVGAALIMSHPSIGRRIVPNVIAAERTRRQAYEQFLAHGVHLTEARTGVLIYVTPGDRRVEIVADVGIHSKVGEAAWEELAQEITGAARNGQLVEGMLNAIRKAGALLAQHFPPSARNPNELSDRMVEI
jgi:putative membrane protein